MLVRSIAASLVLIAAAQARAETLDGQTLSVVLATGADKFDDRVTFHGGQLESSACKTFGFTQAAYTTKKSGDATTFSATLTAAGKGTFVLTGTLKGDVVDGNATWTNGAKVTKYAMNGKKLPSLYERLGGAGAIAQVVDTFIDKLAVDDELNKNPAIKEARGRVPAAHLKFHVTSLVCQVTGGPCTYAGRSMKDSHAKLGINEAEWSRMATIFVGVLNQYKVPKAEQDELLAIVGTTKKDIVTR